MVPYSSLASHPSAFKGPPSKLMLTWLRKPIELYRIRLVMGNDLFIPS
ncbi:MAG: hypothetical protein ISR25_00225 [Candidatus Poseidoniaceae archaeon]|nr:hypothetical protein [Candidatus Poseidoniaceae archaeon]